MALTSFDYGPWTYSLNLPKVIALSVKPYNTTKFIPSSPNHVICFLHCLASIYRVLSSQPKIFSNSSLYFRNWWYKPSLMVQSILGSSMFWLFLFVPHVVDWFWLLFYKSSSLSYCITFMGLWTNWSQVRNPHSVYLLESSSLWCLQRVEPSTGMLQNLLQWI